ncbi:GNAT family N-acetyltransferase [Lysinibacillus sp. NPDC048646]|uniref:GNAT family N-acetyltransferase n=1 Tax=Lysinibacillus sp. NPDC048646 TaxID=3390574 RepID=UPI003D060610
MILSKNCRIEPLKHEHYDDIYSLYSNKSVRTFLGGVPEKNDLDASFNRMLASPFPNTFFYITLKETKEFIGLVSIDEYHEAEVYELSYQFLPQYWGKGYAFEVLSEVRDYGIYCLKLAHLVAETQTANIASCCLLEKLGMQKIKELERFGHKQAVYELRGNLFYKVLERKET